MLNVLMLCTHNFFFQWSSSPEKEADGYRAPQLSQNEEQSVAPVGGYLQHEGDKGKGFKML
jgi:hypothetical protein